MEFCVQRGFGELHQQASGKENCRVRFGVSATMWCLIIFESNHKWIPVAVVIVMIRKMFLIGRVEYIITVPRLKMI